MEKNMDRAGSGNSSDARPEDDSTPLWSYAIHSDLAQITALCEDGIERRGWIIDMPFMGNEHHPCTLRDEAGHLHAVHMSEVIRVVGRDPRRF